jgi:F-type H+-transporting ATPase subunit epsilon
VATHVEVVTPERVLFSGEADFVVMRAEGGDIMFLPNHAPFVGAVDICTVRIVLAGSDAAVPGASGGDDAGAGTAAAAHHGAGTEGEVRLAMAGGFVHVDDNRVTVLAGIAELADEIDVDRAQRALEAAQSAAGGETAPTPSDMLDAEAAAGEPGIEQSPTMRALVHPDDPEVRERRALARLEAAGALGTSSAAPTVAPAR